MRFPQSRQPLDRAITADLDVRWSGVNERMEPGTLPGQQDAAACTAAVNLVFHNGSAQTRDGFTAPVAWNPVLVTALAGWVTSYFMGAGTWTDARGAAWTALAAEPGAAGVQRAVWLLRDGSAPMRVAVESITEDVYDLDFSAADIITFAQCGGELVMWRGALEPMHWSGDLADAFQPSTTATVAADLASGMEPLPAAPFGICMGGRIVFPVGSTEIGWTDILEPRRWDAALSRYQIGDTGGAITGLAEWGTTLVVFKETAVYAVEDFTGDLSAARVVRITDQAGCISHRTITGVGGDLIFLARDGVYRLTEVLQAGAAGVSSSRQLSPVPVSWPIPTTMARVNWKAASGGMACAALAAGLWYLAVPVDGSTENSALFVWDTRSEQWQGEFTSGPWGAIFRALLRSSLYGAEVLQAVQHSYVIASGQGWHDGAAATSAQNIPTRFETRGYALSDAGLNRLRSIIVDTEEHGTSGVTLLATTDGRRVEQTLQTARTRDRTRYLTHGRAARNVANPSDDAQETDREDYALAAADAARIGTGIRLDLMQVHRLKGMVTGRPRWVKAIVTSTGGRLRINAVKAEGFPLAE